MFLYGVGSVPYQGGKEDGFQTRSVSKHRRVDPMSRQSNWMTITESRYPWEREALEFVRAQFPKHEPYRAWANFEFIADDGSINEVDLLVFTPQGFFLVEIKSHQGQLDGDAHSWTWRHEGHATVMDNPLFLANLKAKKLASLLNRQRAMGNRRLPFIEALVFCSAPGLQSKLKGNATYHVCLRDTKSKPGIMAALKSRHCPGLSEKPRGTFNRPMAKAVSRALEQAGIRPSHRSRRVGDYELKDLLDEGPGYQDFLGSHVGLEGALRRIRIYLVQGETDPQQQVIIRRAAEREFRLLQALEHRGVLRALEYTNHELGPAIIFQHHPKAVSLDHFIIQNKDNLTDDLRLMLIRQIAETVSFAHRKHIVHRALSPRSVLVIDPGNSVPQAIVMNWQLGYRQVSGTKSPVTREVTPTVHVEQLSDDTSRLFMAPETMVDEDNLGEHQDVFSLGAICYHLFTGQPPAESQSALAEKLRTHRGLRISAMVNGAPEALDELVQYSTDPDVSVRMDTVQEFLEHLDKVEDELTTPSEQLVGDPTQAKPGDLLPRGFEVIRKIGTGSTAVALLVVKDKREYVMKVAVDTEHNSRVSDEGEVLAKFDSQLVVRSHGVVTINDRVAILMDRAGETTLGQRIRQEGRLSLDLLQRFGEDLLEAVVLLEKKGIAHRDIKPDNIGVSNVGRGDPLHLVLFDFSLSRSSPENIRAGTPGYLDPFLPLRKPPRWDLQAERFAAAVTLYQMATGAMPTWYDGLTDPSMVECEATIDAERFFPNLRPELTAFFRQALGRNPSERFDNAQEMLRVWRDLFKTTTDTQDGSFEGEEDNRALLDAATTETSIAELGLGGLAVDALDRINVLKVADLLTTPGRKLARMRGVGNKTRKRILSATKILRKRLRLGVETTNGSVIEDTFTYEGRVPKEQLSIDMLVQRILKAKSRSRNATETTALEALLGLDDRIESTWPSQSEVAPLAGVTRGRVSQILGDAVKRWRKDPTITVVRDEISNVLDQNGGVMSSEELCQWLRTARGSLEDDPLATRRARAVTRAAIETENLLEFPKFQLRRDSNNALIALDPSLADYASSLGRKADELAQQDPVIPPTRVVEMLRQVELPPEADPLSDTRLVRLAAAASQNAAVSSRQELYPRNMDSERALKLSQGALVGSRVLTIEQIRQRVSSRYPLAAELPNRPKLDKLLKDFGLPLTWDEDAGHKGAYVSNARSVLSVTDVTGTGPRYTTISTSPRVPTPSFKPDYVDPEIAEARQFEDRLRYAEKNGTFLVMTVKSNLYERAKEELTERFEVQALDLETLFIDSLHKAADEAGADWHVVVAADAAPPNSGDWRNLNQLIASMVIPKVEQVLTEGEKTILTYHPNWLARYNQLPMLSHVYEAVQAGKIHGVWILLPASSQTTMPLMDGVAVPVITSNQWASIPDSWCQNLHRSNGRDESPKAEPGSGSG